MVSEEKEALRRVVLKAKKSEEYNMQADRLIIERLLSLPEYQNADVISCFVGMSHEINTRPILEDILRSDKRLCVPLCILSGHLAPGYMEMRYISSLDELSRGTMGILEPSKNASIANPDEIDLLVVPCLACDYKGHRLGHGGGFYDGYLSHYTGKAIMICREQQVYQEIPIESHDISVPLILTERKLYQVQD